MLSREAIHAVASTAVYAAYTGGSELDDAVETIVLTFSVEDQFSFAMLLIATAEHLPWAKTPPYQYVSMRAHAPGQPATSDDDDIVLTLLSFGFGRVDRADLDGVHAALGDARRRGRLLEVLRRLAIVAAGAAEVTQLGS